jgi:hypothetical protein
MSRLSALALAVIAVICSTSAFLRACSSRIACWSWFGLQKLKNPLEAGSGLLRVALPAFGPRAHARSSERAASGLC